MGWPYRAYIKIAKNGDFRETVLATSCCHGLGAMASEVIQNIDTDTPRVLLFPE